MLGLVNGVVIAKLRLPTLIVTLGTSGIFKGVLIAYIGAKYIADLPGPMTRMGQPRTSSRSPSGGEVANLHVLIVPVIALCVLVVAWVLSRTMWGRSIYAIGGDAEAARRAGIPGGPHADPAVHRSSGCSPRSAA